MRTYSTREVCRRVNLDTGMMRVHSPDEYLALDDLERLCALVLQMIMLAPEFAPRPAASRA